MRTSNNGYNGWTNYETWLVALNLDNEATTSRYAHFVAESSDSWMEFRDTIAEYCYDVEADLYALSDRWLERDWLEINWYEVYQSFLEE